MNALLAGAAAEAQHVGRLHAGFKPVIVAVILVGYTDTDRANDLGELDRVETH